MAVFLSRGVDLRRKVPKPRRVKAPVDPISLKRNIPKKRRTFLDPEDVTFAMMAGPQAIKELLQSGQNEIQKIYREMESLYKPFITNPHAFASDYRVSTFWDCDESPIGLCMYDLVEDRHCDQCVFCGEPNERK